MKDYENILKALECCAAEGNAPCDECPYINNNCRQKDRDARELILELKAQLEQPATECDYEAISHKLGEELERVEIENERIQRELSEAQKELAYLRAVKATTEAFLGVKI